jgi:MFS family permease
MTALFSGAALMNAAMAVASAMGTIVAADRLGTRWGGVPSTAGIVGTGAGALALTWLMNRRGRRMGLVAGYLASACGAVLAAVAVAAVDVLLLSIGMTLLGLGNAGAQLSRYAAAELYPAGRRGFAISMVVWAGAVGAVGGPLLLGPSGEAATAVGWAAATGPFLFASLATLGAAFAVVGVRPPLAEAVAGGHVSPPARAIAGGVPTRAAPGVSATDPARVRLREVARWSGARTALAVMATAQVVMVAVMTATPLDMHLHGEGMGSIGVTLPRPRWACSRSHR